VNFYPSINEDLLNAALDWAEQFTSISNRDRDIIRRKMFNFESTIIVSRGKFMMIKEEFKIVTM